MIRRMIGRVLATLLLVALAVSVGGVAYAYWTGSGDGAAGATTGTTALVTLSPGTAGADLRPGGYTDVILSVSNPNLSEVHIGSLSLDTSEGVGFAVDPPHSGCSTSTLSFVAQQTNSGDGWTIPAKVIGDGSLSVVLADAVAMGIGADNACQGAVITVYLKAGS